ncbi:ATPase domain-containing protein [Halodesulfurarchaeum formicicum]|uniref:ATPase domain-containing protein n=1 Tax=Halodesulfurarchaeum formicicum TaxID=1873524 RepID=UPI000878B885|nr:ATPase domain-containing protein [Halodesulfurarchaeum formicicum]
MNGSNTQSSAELIHSGIPELDELLRGGYQRGRVYLVQGVSGSGKTLIGQHFLEAGLENDETVVYIHGEESQRDILANSHQVGLEIGDAEFLDIGPGTDFFADDVAYDLVETSEIDAERFTEDIHAVIKETDPSRVLLDPITQLQYVERDEYQYRKRLQSFIRFLKDRDITILVTRTIRSDLNRGGTVQTDIASLSDGIISLHLDEGERRIGIQKHRGIGQRDGTHGLEIRDHGVEVFPQVIPDHSERTFEPQLNSTGHDGLDGLLEGGLEQGSITFVSGPTGIGKSTIGAQLLEGALRSEGNALGYLFEESVDQFRYRADNLGIPVSEYLEQDEFRLKEIEPLVLSAEEFTRIVLQDVAEMDANMVLIDGLSGFKISLQGDKQRLVRRLHALTRELKNKGVSVVITDENQQLTGNHNPTSENTSYLADNILFLSYIELQGELHRTIGVLKKRLGSFDRRFHRFSIVEDEGVVIESPFDDVQGILQGRPTHVTDNE